MENKVSIFRSSSGNFYSGILKISIFNIALDLQSFLLLAEVISSDMAIISSDISPVSSYFSLLFIDKCSIFSYN